MKDFQIYYFQKKMEDFQIISELGKGVYSTIFKVKRKIDNKIYALKKVKLLNLSDKEKESSLNEVRILASVKSNFIISYKEAFLDEKENTLCIVMEFADSGDLYQKIIEHKKCSQLFEESDIWRIFIQLVKGLKSLHNLKILHRDFKSANVLLFSDGRAKLGDLNISKVAKKGLGYTQTGTPYYSSPEVWKDMPYDNKSDIWSLGCVLYEMITLKPPFRAKNMEDLFHKVCKGQYDRIPDKFSDDLFQVVQILLQVDSSSRPSCEQILNHPTVMKKIEYFKSFAKEEENEDNLLLKTIHMPKNLLFLSDKLPKPNYEQQFKSTNNPIEDNANKDLSSFNKDNNNRSNNNNNKEVLKNIMLENKKKSLKLLSLSHKRKEKEKEKEKEKLNIIQNNNLKNKEDYKISSIESNLIIDKNPIRNKIGLIKIKINKELYKNDLIFRNNNRRIDYAKNISLFNDPSTKDLNPIMMPTLISKSVPKKIDNNILINNKSNIKIPYLKTINNHHNLNIKNGLLPKIPRKLMPMKKPILNNIL